MKGIEKTKNKRKKQDRKQNKTKDGINEHLSIIV